MSINESEPISEDVCGAVDSYPFCGDSNSPIVEGAETLGELGAEVLSDIERIDQFWKNDPVKPWKEKAVEAIEALENGVDIVLVSGRQGTGKTMQFGRLLESAYPNEPMGYDASLIQSATEIILKQSIRLLLIDEMTEAVHDGFYGEMLDQLVGQRQLVLIFPGVTADNRRAAVDKVKEHIQARTPDVRVRDLGDDAISQVDQQKALDLLYAIKAPTDLIEHVDKFPALLNPRLFGAILLLNPQATWSTVDAMRSFIVGEQGGVSSTLFANLVEGRTPEPHGPFLSTSLSTAEAIQLYEMAGVPLPDPNVFNVNRLGFNPYEKS